MSISSQLCWEKYLAQNCVKYHLARKFKKDKQAKDSYAGIYF